MSCEVQTVTRPGRAPGVSGWEFPPACTAQNQSRVCISGEVLCCPPALGRPRGDRRVEALSEVSEPGAPSRIPGNAGLEGLGSGGGSMSQGHQHLWDLGSLSCSCRPSEDCLKACQEQIEAALAESLKQASQPQQEFSSKAAPYAGSQPTSTPTDVTDVNL
uniref:Uncharacterized protein n=1 Tax=Junco hyemalis TaxID=40217 RepID=A0A8C5JKV8_JUNHY